MIIFSEEKGQILNNKGGTLVWFDYMDNLRALALIVGVLFHAAMAYSPMFADIWPAANQEKSNLMAYLAFFTHTFRMPLFFLISGFFAHMLLEKRATSAFLKNRLIRIFIPFAVFLPLVTIGLILGVLWAIKTVEHPSPFLLLVAPVISDPQAHPLPLPFSTGHLWFLYNLLLFCGVLALLWKVKLAKSNWTPIVATPKFVLFILPLLLMPALASVVAPYPAPDSLYPQLWSFCFFGIFYLVGFALYQNQSLLDELNPYVRYLCLISIALYSCYFMQIKDIKMTLASVYEHKFLWTDLPLSGIEAIVSVYMTICCLVLGKKYLDRKSRLLRVISKSSYWIYIIHLPVLLIIQYSMMNIDLGVELEFLISSLGTLIIGLASYYLLVKSTPIGWLLNGEPKASLN